MWGKKTQTPTNTGTHGQTLTDTITNPHASEKGGRGLLFRNLQETLAYRQVRNLSRQSPWLQNWWTRITKTFPEGLRRQTTWQYPEGQGKGQQPGCGQSHRQPDRSFKIPQHKCH